MKNNCNLHETFDRVPSKGKGTKEDTSGAGSQSKEVEHDGREIEILFGGRRMQNGGEDFLFYSLPMASGTI